MGNESQSESKQSRSVGFKRVLASIAFLLLAIALSVIVVGTLASYGFGNILATPRVVADLRQENLSLQQTVTVLQGQETNLEQGSAGNAQDISALEQEMQTLDQRMQSFEQQAEDLVLLSNELQENIDEVATIQAESEEGRMAIVVMATVQAEREERLVQIEENLNDVRERTNRLFRFVERLNDLTGQTESGLEIPDEAPASDGTPSSMAPAASPTPTRTPSPRTTPRTEAHSAPMPVASTHNAEENDLSATQG